MKRVVQTVGSFVVGCIIVLLTTAPAYGVGSSFLVPLTITSVVANNIGLYGAMIAWETNSAASSQVFFDTQFHDGIADYVYQSGIDSTLVTKHNVGLTGLSNSTLYHYRVRSVVNVDGIDRVAVSDDRVFRTLTPIPATVPVTTSVSPPTQTVATSPSPPTSPPPTSEAPTGVVAGVERDIAVINNQLAPIALDSSGNRLKVTGNMITITELPDALILNLPVALQAGQVLGSFMDAAGLLFQNNRLEIPASSLITGDDSILQVIDEEHDLGTLLIIETDDEVGTGDKAIAKIRMIRTESGFTYKNFTKEDPALGEVGSSISLELKTIPVNGKVKVTTSLDISEEAGLAFQLVGAAEGIDAIAVAYTINVEKNNIENGTDIASADITMIVGADWVAQHGGIESIRIYRYAPETGDQEILETVFAGYDYQGRAIFEAHSPGGLSVFALIGLPESRISEWIFLGIVPGAAVIIAIWIILAVKRRRRRNKEEKASR